MEAEVLDKWPIIEILLGIISFLGISLIGVVIYVYKNFGKTLEKNDKSIEALHKKLTEHEDSMGKASKAIHGDMLEVQKNFHEIKKEFSDETVEMKKQMSKLKIEANELVSSLKISTDHFNEKYTKIVEVQDKLKELEQSIESNNKNIISNKEAVDTYRLGVKDGEKNKQTKD